MYTFKIFHLTAVYLVAAYLVYKEVKAYRKDKQRDKLISQVMDWQEQTLPSSFRIELSRLERMSEKELKELLN
jgi:hypothetical protein